MCLRPFAVLVLLALLGCAPSGPQEWHQRGRQLVDGRPLRALSAGERAQAEACQLEALAQDSSHSAAALDLAALYCSRGAYEAAAPVYRRLIEARPDLAAAYAGLGLSLAAQGRYSAAQRAYQDAIRRGDRSALVYARLGHAYQALGHRRQHLLAAEAAYRASLVAQPDQADVLLHLSRVLERLERPQEGAPLLRKAIELAPDDSGIRAELAGLYGRLGQRQKGRLLLEGGKDDALMSFALGQWHFEGGDQERAQSYFERALEQDSTLVPAYRYLGLVYSGGGRLEPALAAFARLERLRPADPAAKVDLGIVLTRLGRHREAAEHFERALALGAGDAALKLGALHVHLNRLREGVAVFKKGLELAPANAELHASLGDAYRQMGILGAALKAGKEAVRLEPERALWHFHLAATYERLDGRQAQRQWRRYLELAAADPGETSRLEVARQRLAVLERGIDRIAEDEKQ